MPVPPYAYWPIIERPPIEWPGGKTFAFYIGLNIEHFHVGRPAASVIGLTADLPVDPPNHGWRDYSTRVGVWRMIELLDRMGLRASVLLNAEVCEQYPQIIRAGAERDWAWLGHGRTNSELWTGLEPGTEREALRSIAATITKATGKAPRGWLGLALHPFLSGQPSRLRYLEEALDHIRGRDDVWYTTSDEIAAWYLDHHYDTAVRAFESGGGNR